MRRFELALYAGSVIYAPGETILLPIPRGERPLRGDAGRIDWRLRGEISSKLRSGFISGVTGEATLLPARAPLRAKRLLLLGVGPAGPGGSCEGDLANILYDAAVRLSALRASHVLLALPAAIELERGAPTLLAALIGGLGATSQGLAFRLVVPEAGPRAARLEEAMVACLEPARRAGWELEVGWVTSEFDEPSERVAETIP
ncbi:MAG: M17 family peptidase N-terminal domain-containing protein [Myxococcota bacterium]